MQIKTPDIGVDKAVVAEILVKVGDSIAENDSLVLLESDKASVEVPSTSAGVVKSILIKEGDSVTEGTVLLELEAEGAAPVAQAEEAQKLHQQLNKQQHRQRSTAFNCCSTSNGNH